MGTSVAPRRLPVPVVFQADGAAAAWTNQPAARTLYRGYALIGQVMDLRPYTQVRFYVVKGATAAVAGATMNLAYNAAGGSVVVGDYTDIAGTSLAIDTTNAWLDSGWVSLPAAARVAAASLAPVGTGGDAVVDPSFGAVVALLR